MGRFGAYRRLTAHAERRLINAWPHRGEHPLTEETGTGKEVVAQAITPSAAATKPFVPVDCGQSLRPSRERPFGHERGSFTG